MAQMAVSINGGASVVGTSPRLSFPSDSREKSFTALRGAVSGSAGVKFPVGTLELNVAYLPSYSKKLEYPDSESPSSKSMIQTKVEEEVINLELSFQPEALEVSLSDHNKSRLTIGLGVFAQNRTVTFTQQGGYEKDSGVQQFNHWLLGGGSNDWCASKLS